MLLVSTLRRGDIRYYSNLGPIFGSRQIAKEIGIHVYDDEDKVFYQAKTWLLQGILSVRGGLISDCYVFPEFRRQGVLTTLLRAATLEQRDYRATCTPMSLGVFLKEGFQIKKVMTNFTKVEKNA